MQIKFLLLTALLAFTSAFGVTVFPASTNGNNVFTGTNSFTKPVRGDSSSMTNNSGYASDPDAAAYILRAGVSSDANKRAIVGFVQTLKDGGVWPYVVDAAFFKTNQGGSSSLVNPMTTLMGRTCGVTNVLYDTFGFNMSNGVVVVSGLPDTRTNTLLIVAKNWGGEYGVAAPGNSPSMIGVFGGPGNSSCERLFDRGYYGADFVNNNASAFTNGVYTMAFAPISDGTTDVDQKRRVVGVCFSNLNMQIWADGARTAPTITDVTTAPYVPSVPLTNLWIGNTPDAGQPLSSKIEAFVVLSSYGNTNHIQCVQRALRWLEPSKVNTVFFGDSLCVNAAADDASAANNFFTKGWPWLLMNSAPNAGDECWWNEAASGSTTAAWDGSSILTNRLNMSMIGGPVEKLRVYMQLGANDELQNATAAGTIQHLSNILAVALPPYKAEVYVVNITPIGIYNTGGWSDAQDGERSKVNNWLAANPQYYTKLYDRAQLYTKEHMNNTNAATGYTRDFLHPNIRGNAIFTQHILGMDSGTSPLRVSYLTNGAPSFATLLNGGAKFFGRSTTPSGWEVGMSNGVIWCSNGINFYRTVSTDGTNSTTVSFP